MLHSTAKGHTGAVTICVPPRSVKANLIGALWTQPSSEPLENAETEEMEEYTPDLESTRDARVRLIILLF